MHHAKRRVLTAAGEWRTPILLGFLDDHSRLGCHLQWYLAETAEVFVHGLCQAFMKRGYLRRRDNQIVMTVEHRAARGLNDIEIELADDGQGAALRLRRQVPDEAVPTPDTAEQRIVEVLAEAEEPLSQAQIRTRAAARNATVSATLQELIRDGRVERASKACYRLTATAATPRAVIDANGQHEAFPKSFPA